MTPLGVFFIAVQSRLVGGDSFAGSRGIAVGKGESG